MKRHQLTGLLAAVALLAATASAQTFSGMVETTDFCTTFTGFCVGTSPGTLTITGVPTGASSDGSLRLETLGDLNSTTSESYSVTVEGHSMGIVTNGNTSDDSFDHSTDRANQCGSTPFDTTGMIPAATLAGIIADGQVVITVTPTATGINDICSLNLIRFTLDFTQGSGPGPAVPATTPLGALILVGIVLLSLAVMGRRAS